MGKLLLATIITTTFSVASIQAASNGTINFTGEVLDKTCDITINGDASPATVVLQAVDKSQLDTVGATAKRTGFNIELRNCAGSASVSSAAAFFENGSTVDPTGYRLNNTITDGTEAANVQLQLVDAPTGNAIKIGSPDQHTSSSTYDLSSGSATLPYAVEYYATDEATPGLVASSVNFTINYF